MGRDIHDIKTPQRPVRKRCTKCKRSAWAAKDDIRCWRTIEVVRGLNKPFEAYCGGTLHVVKRAKRKVRVATDLPAVAERKRADAARAQALAAGRAKKLQAKIKRLQTALRKQQRRERHFGRLAARSDADIALQRERIKTAQLVQTVTRRLLKAAGVGKVEQGG